MNAQSVCVYVVYVGRTNSLRTDKVHSSDLAITRVKYKIVNETV